MENPIHKFEAWLDEARQCPAIADATAMTLATASDDGIPAARTVLLKSYDADGFTFYTNLTSRKGEELITNPRAALLFYWMPLDKQVRIEGAVLRVDDAEADAYFASRDRLKQAGAWASLQSRPLDSRDTLIARTEAVEQEYAGKPIPRPPHWSGFRVAPQRMEFWFQRDGRLHERELFTRSGTESWQHHLLYP